MDLLKNLDDMITAEKFINQEEYNGVEPSGYFHGEAWDYFESKMIEFAKLHVEAALKQASEKALLGNTENGVYSVLAVSKESILNAYSLENIK